MQGGMCLCSHAICFSLCYRVRCFCLRNVMGTAYTAKYGTVAQKIVDILYGGACIVTGDFESFKTLLMVPVTRNYLCTITLGNSAMSLVEILVLDACVVDAYSCSHLARVMWRTDLLASVFGSPTYIHMCIKFQSNQVWMSLILNWRLWTNHNVLENSIFYRYNKKLGLDLLVWFSTYHPTPRWRISCKIDDEFGQVS